MTAKDKLDSPTYLQSGFAFTKLVQKTSQLNDCDTAEMLTGDITFYFS